MRKALPRDRGRKSVIPLPHPVQIPVLDPVLQIVLPEDLEW